MAAVKTNGTTVNTGLVIPIVRGNDIPKLRDKMWYKLRLTYYGLEAMIIDELYMVSNVRLYQSHL